MRLSLRLSNKQAKKKKDAREEGRGRQAEKFKLISLKSN